MKICPKCSNEFDSGKWDKKFCSRKCANSRSFTKESNEKRSKTLKDSLKSIPDSKKHESIKKRLESLALTMSKRIRPMCVDCGKIISKENKHNRCQICYYKSDACSHALGHYRNYERMTVTDSLGNSVFLMSSLEIQYYNYLVKNNVRWKKPNSIVYKDNLGKEHWYKPDFELIDSNEIIEIKGYFWNNDKIKMKWVIEQNPSLDIKILTKKDLKNIGA